VPDSVYNPLAVQPYYIHKQLWEMRRYV